MSYLGQSIRNRFPLWSKTRRDSSSVAALMIDSFGEALEEIRFGIYKQINQNKVISNKPVSEPSHLKVFNLIEDPSFVSFRQENIDLVTLQADASLSNEIIPLIEVNSYEEICKAFPTRISLLEADSNYYYYLETLSGRNPYSNNTYEYYKKPSRIYINVENITDFEDISVNSNAMETSYIIIRGKDSFGKRCEERIEIKNKGLYETKVVFKTIEPLIKDQARSISGGPSIECYGFEGDLDILKYPVQVTDKGYELKMFNKVNDELNYQESLREAKSFFRLENQGSFTDLVYLFRAYEDGREYISSRTDTDTSFFEQELLKQRLVSFDEDDLIISDYCFDEVRDRLLSIDVNGNIHWHKISHTYFQKQQYPRSKKTFLSLESEKQRVSLNETLKMHVSVERPKGTLFKILVARQKPSFRDLDQEGFLFEYLQDDLTWSETINFYNGNDTTDLFYTFDGLTFDNSFDEFGQHDFYVFAFTDNYSSYFSLEDVADGTTSKKSFKNTILKAIKEENPTVFIDRYSVMCEKNIAEKTINTDILEKISDLNLLPEDYALSIWTEGVENKIYIAASNETQTLIWELKEYKDYIVYSHVEGTGVLLEDYDSVTITINNSYTETLNG